MIADVSSLNGMIVIELSYADKFLLDLEREKKGRLREWFGDTVKNTRTYLFHRYPSLLAAIPPKSDRSYMHVVIGR